MQPSHPEQTSTASPGELVNQALAAFKARDRDETARCLSQLVQMDPPIGKTWNSIARLADTIGEVGLAITSARRGLMADPTPSIRNAYAQLLSRNGRNEQALAEATAWVRDHPNDPAALHFLATCQVQMGDTEAAMANLRRVLALPNVALGSENAWSVIADIKKFVIGDPDIDAMTAMLERIGTSEARRLNRAVLLYALGKAYDDIGEVDKAFAAFDEAARLQRLDSAFNAEVSSRFVDDVVANYDANFIDSLPRSEVESDRPIFVLGLPRSGTTLVEQILVSHSDVSDGAEVDLFRHAAMTVPSYSPAVVREAFSGPDAAHMASRIARSYLHMLDERFGKDGKVIDKTLNQTRFLGLIHQVLPKAKMIWLRRQPGGVVWSCYRTRFAKGADWTRSLTDMGRHFRAEDRLHAHWSAVLGDSLLTVPYEQLVDDPDTWMRRILEHVGLDWQDQVKDFHATDRAVTTASFAQVRKPMYTSSKEGWRRYEQHLKPFFDAYGKA